MAEEKKNLRAGDPLVEGAKAASATVAAIIPGPGTLISAALWGGLQADTTRRWNEILKELQDRIERSGRTPEELLGDDTFRAGLALLHHSTLNQEAESKLRRIQAFLAHRLKNYRGNTIVPEAVLRAFTALPASHIEQFLSLIADSEDNLRDFAMARGGMRLDSDLMLKTEFPDTSNQDHCGSLLDSRAHELQILFASLESAGLIERLTTYSSMASDSPEASAQVFETTAFAKDFVWYCLLPAQGQP